MIFQPGNVHRFRPGETGNPAGRAAGFPTLRKQAVHAVMQIVDEVLTDPANLQRWRRYVQEKWTEDPGAFLRNVVLPLSPRETLTMLRTTENGLAALTVSQLRAIAATLPQDTENDQGQGEDKGKVIDVSGTAQEGTEQGESVREDQGKDFDSEAGF
jgi:hypothetical protein